MDRKKFFDNLRASGAVFGKSLTADNVAGTEAILDACIFYRVSDPWHVAHIMAHVYHETGGTMAAVKETVMPSHKDRNPSDAEVIRRLDTAFKNGKLPWVKTPYWRNGAFGRGQIQVTHHDNYVKLGKAIGVDMSKDYSLALDLKNSATVAVVGMSRGLFTGKKLSDYKFPAALNNPPESHPRRIVNGKDGTDAKVATYTKAFYSALVAGGYELPKDEPAPDPQTAKRTRAVVLAEIKALIAELEAIGG